MLIHSTEYVVVFVRCLKKSLRRKYILRVLINIFDALYIKRYFDMFYV